MGLFHLDSIRSPTNCQSVRSFCLESLRMLFVVPTALALFHYAPYTLQGYFPLPPSVGNKNTYRDEAVGIRRALETTRGVLKLAGTASKGRDKRICNARVRFLRSWCTRSGSRWG